MPEDHHQCAEGATRVPCARASGQDDERSCAEFLGLHAALSSLLASPLTLDELAPLLLERLTRELQLVAAELWVRRDTALVSGRARHWFVDSGGARARKVEFEDEAPGLSAPNCDATLHCGLELPLVASRGARAVIRLYSRGPGWIDARTLQLLTAVADQLTRVLECDTLDALLAESAAGVAASALLASTGRAPDSYAARLRTLPADLLLAEERERRQLALDLHDGLSQTLALIQIRVASIKESARKVERDALMEVERLVDQANRAARSVTFELSPPVLHDLGLEPALEWLVQNITERYGVTVRFEHDDAPKPADERTRIILFRSVRELLINAAKHAQARSVVLAFTQEDGMLVATVADDGKGMEPDPKALGGTGLLSITERIHHVGGRVSITSEHGRGTRIELRAPASTVPTERMETAS